ncbi:MAG: hypothetical protein Q8R02_18055, partial [Hyphomonadaceae bacterium]|nr:hypothetical protein [Hyphomonadaceae bacterium]
SDLGISADMIDSCDRRAECAADRREDAARGGGRKVQHGSPAQPGEWSGRRLAAGSRVDPHTERANGVSPLGFAGNLSQSE